MTLECAKCPSFVCRGGRRDAGPENCPMRGDFPEFQELYENGDGLRLAVRAALVEGEGYCRWSRLREIAEFARLMEITRLGIAHCPDMAREAALAASYLHGTGLEPVLPPCPPRSDPLGQARFFENQETELNVLAGMCVGHEAMFIRASAVPATVLVARDRRLRHNPAAALYTSRSYLKNDVFGHWTASERPEFQGWDLETLDRVAQETLTRGHGNRSRVGEAMDMAHRLGATHLGISFCVGFREEAKILTKLLETNGFQVSSACCKTGAVPKEDVGIRDSQKVRPGRREMICNPLAQAELLNREKVEFALVLGQCVGHDAATFQKLDAPAACLVAKDRLLAHNTVAAFY